ncbi:GCN5-related protein N-acetyltransferase [Beutenbergia cavernae DSM 12333]|uniref:GCN5-related protein N-acetyltransferase n=1 Tax=Beutenbergia cavernae (strain ATCC BAA-8 / DSM 12333 / CCUG 43141 / JCM 11478 / NBRC 16432 / NCIMB 13614 / HKI 0122) TaxID=471853 RepID=C5C4M5_BEUC1|nr:GNAT family N-acetyltransferase [Beutenbergia cavernae]ACQ82149.1 GCN5-related protein N-acetyltransferase [Beutenbergia cavernae DSM 12333]
MSVFFAPEPLADHHRVDEFTCGVSSLDDWLKRRALSNATSGASQTFVVADPSDAVVAYYSLSTGSIMRGDLPRGRRHGTPQPVPVLLIGRFAVDVAHHGAGIGRSLLQDALQRCLRLTSQIGFMFVLVHPVNDAADGFWRKYGFVDAPTEQPMLLLPLDQLRRMRLPS